MPYRCRPCGVADAGDELGAKAPARPAGGRCRRQCGHDALRRSGTIYGVAAAVLAAIWRPASPDQGPRSPARLHGANRGAAPGRGRRTASRFMYRRLSASLTALATAAAARVPASPAPWRQTRLQRRHTTGRHRYPAFHRTSEPVVGHVGVGELAALVVNAFSNSAAPSPCTTPP